MWYRVSGILKFIYSENATKFCEIFTLLLSYVVPVKSKVKISQNFKAFSEYMNFIKTQIIYQPFLYVFLLTYIEDFFPRMVEIGCFASQPFIISCLLKGS